MSVPWWAYYVLKEGYVSDYYSVQFIQPKKWGNLKTTDILQTWVSVFIGFSGSTSWGSRGCIILFHGLNCTIRPYNGSWVWFNINNNFSNIYSYFEKGCREKCTRPSWKVFWVVLRSLKFFKEIWKSCMRGHGRMFASATEKQQK